MVLLNHLKTGRERQLHHSKNNIVWCLRAATMLLYMMNNYLQWAIYLNLHDKCSVYRDSGHLQLATGVNTASGSRDQCSF